jgi:diguanylate cyclase (GGDEF)-like protein
VLVAVAVFFFSKYVFLLWTAPDLRAAWDEIEAVFWVIPVLFIIVYLVVERQIAMLLTVTYATLMLIAGSLRVLNVDDVLFLELVRLHARIAAIGLLVFVLARAKDDLLETQRAAFEMQWAANTDALTRLPNRRRLTAMLDHLIAEQRQFALISVDVDHFKRINDTLGHAAGDLVLTELGERLRHQLRADDVVGRWGGEEFLILAHEHDSQQAAQLAERLRQAIAAQPFSGDLRVTVSMGGAIRQSDDSSHTLLHRADTALYRAKDNGRNRIEWT